MLFSIRRTTQFKYAVIYVLITAVALVCLNLLTLESTWQMMKQNKHSAVIGRVQLVAASFSGTEALTQDSVHQVMDLLDDVKTDRIIVTDLQGLCLYDSSETQNMQGKVALIPEIVSALSGNDVVYCAMNNRALQSHAATPILYLNSPIGAVYLMERDAAQADLFRAISLRTVSISVVLGLAIILFSFLFSVLFSKRMHKILNSIAIVREGNYSHVLDLRGNDELSDLSEEFNKLTSRLHDAEEVRRQFVSDASHELKTPLASIKLLSDSILQHEMPMPTVQEFVRDIGNEADRLTRMSTKLLTLSKLDSNVQELGTVVDATDVVQRVCRILQPQAQLKSIHIERDLAWSCYMYNYEDSLHQIVFNLVENAIKYNYDGGSVMIRVCHDNKNVTIEVADTGFGIPEEEMSHIFDRFYRVDKARSRAMGGSGLGLSIVHDLVEHNDGEITVRANPEGGTIFTAVFPYVMEEDEA